MTNDNTPDLTREDWEAIDHDAGIEILEARTRLRGNLDAMLTHLGKVRRALADLLDLYDVEVAEGPGNRVLPAALDQIDVGIAAAWISSPCPHDDDEEGDR